MSASQRAPSGQKKTPKSAPPKMILRKLVSVGEVAFNEGLSNVEKVREECTVDVGSPWTGQ